MGGRICVIAGGPTPGASRRDAKRSLRQHDDELWCTVHALLRTAGSYNMGKVNSDLFGEILKGVSRTFYLSLMVLPKELRRPVGLAYLFARAADTIADTQLISRDKRLEYLELFRAEVRGNGSARIQEVSKSLTGPQKNPEERALLDRLEECIVIYRALDAADRERVRHLILTITRGMQMDLITFPAEEEGGLIALKTRGDLDQYTYLVAGCVGEFWTDLMCAYRRGLRAWNVRSMAEVGVRFGKGLQLTNVVKDIAHDLQRGRCYVPEPMLAEHGLAPQDLLDPRNLSRFRPVLTQLVRMTVDHLDQGWLYTLAIPRHETRLRLACMWPILSAGESLKLVRSSPDVLNPTVKIKISRSKVYGMMAVTILTGACAYTGTAYWGRLRKYLT